ncbi:MAG: hypothetical protein R6X27_01055 [Candidatus Desulfacyla sp.]
MEKGLSRETSNAVEKAGELCKTSEDDVRLSRFLFEKGLKEESAKALNAGKERSEKLEDLLRIAHTARAQGFLTLALEALERVKRQGDKRLSALKEEIRVLKEAKEKARQDLKSLRSERNKASVAVFLYAVRGLAWTIFGILVLAGCAIKAVQIIDVFRDPNVFSPKIGKIEGGARIASFEKDGNFFKVSHGGLEGYVYKDFCKLQE